MMNFIIGASIGFVIGFIATIIVEAFLVWLLVIKASA